MLKKQAALRRSLCIDIMARKPVNDYTQCRSIVFRCIFTAIFLFVFVFTKTAHTQGLQLIDNVTDNYPLWVDNNMVSINRESGVYIISTNGKTAAHIVSNSPFVIPVFLFGDGKPVYMDKGASKSNIVDYFVYDVETMKKKMIFRGTEHAFISFDKSSRTVFLSRNDTREFVNIPGVKFELINNNCHGVFASVAIYKGVQYLLCSKDAFTINGSNTNKLVAESNFFTTTLNKPANGFGPAVGTEFGLFRVLNGGMKYSDLYLYTDESGYTKVDDMVVSWKLQYVSDAGILAYTRYNARMNDDELVLRDRHGRAMKKFIGIRTAMFSISPSGDKCVYIADSTDNNSTSSSAAYLLNLN